MRALAILCAILGVSLAKPNGVYHEEYQYKAQSQSYRNNELQHKNEDEGYYSKDGDLLGRYTPKVNAHQQHSEYINPKLKGGYNEDSHYGSGMIYDDNYGSSSVGSSIYDANTFGSNSRLSSTSGYTGGQYAGSSYHTGISSSALSDLTQRLQQDLSRQLQQAVRNQYRQSSSYSRSSTQMQSDIRELEQELRRNLTLQLHDALQSQYGSQFSRGGYSYSTTGGTINPTANYNSHQLEEMRRQLEQNLISKLNEEVRVIYASSNSYQGIGGTVTHMPGSYPDRPTPQPIVIRPYFPSSGSSSTTMTYNRLKQYTPIPNPDSITTIGSRVQNDLNNYLNMLLDETRTTYLTTTNTYLTTSHLDNHIRNLRNQLERNITTLMDQEIRRNYGNQQIINSYAYSVTSDGERSPNYNYRISDLTNLQNEIKQHLLTKFDREFETIRTRFVQQKSSQSYSSGYRPTYQPTYNSGTSSQYMTNEVYGNSHAGSTSVSQIDNYEWNRMQQQLQQELSRRLEEALRQQQYKHRYQQSGAYSSSSFNPNQNYEMTLQQLTEELRRNLTKSLDDSLQGKFGGSSSSLYSYSVSSGSYSPYSNQISSLKSQLQDDLMQQLRQGLQQTYSKYSSFSSSSSSSSSSNYGYGGSNSYGYGGSHQRMADCTSDCMMGDDPTTYISSDEDTQVTEKPFGSSGYSSYRRTVTVSKPSYTEVAYVGSIPATAGSTTHYSTGRSGNSYQSSYGHHTLTGSTSHISTPGFNLGYSGSGSHSHLHNADFPASHSTGGYGGNRQLYYSGSHSSSHNKLHGGEHSFTYHTTGYNYKPGTTHGHNIGQEIDNDDELTQQTEDMDLTQVNEDANWTNSHGGSHTMLTLGNNQYSGSKDTEKNQVELLNGKPKQTSHIMGENLIGQKQDSDEDIISSSHVTNTGKHLVFGQEIDNTDLVQQTENGFGELETEIQKLQKNKNLSGQITLGFGQEIDNDDLVQQTENGFEQFQTANQKLQKNANSNVQTTLEFGQQTEDEDLVQKTENGFEQFETSNQKLKKNKNLNSQSTLEFGQQTEDEDLVQQTENGFEQFESANQKLQTNKNLNSQSILEFGQQTEDEDLVQQTENGFEQFESANQKLQKSINLNSQSALEFGQQTEDEDLVQQSVNGFDQFETSNQKLQTNKMSSGQSTLEFGQNIDGGDLVQKTENEFGQLDNADQKLNLLLQSNKKYIYGQNTSQVNQGSNNEDLTQKTENFESGNQKINTNGDQNQLGFGLQTIEGAGRLSTGRGTSGQYGGSNQQVTQQNWIYSTNQNKIEPNKHQYYGQQQSKVVHNLDFSGQQIDNSDFTAQTADDSMERDALLTKKIMALQSANTNPILTSGSASISLNQNVNQFPASSSSQQTTSQTQNNFGNNYEHITAEDIQKMTYGERLVYQDYLKLKNAQLGTAINAAGNDQSVNSNLGRNSVQYEVKPLSINTGETSGYTHGTSQVFTTSTHGSGQGQTSGRGTSGIIYTTIPSRDVSQQHQISSYGSSGNVISGSSSGRNTGYQITTGQGTGRIESVSPGLATSVSSVGSGYGSASSHTGYGHSSGTSQTYELSSPDLDHTSSGNYGLSGYGSQIGGHRLSSSSSIYTSGSRSDSSYGGSYGTHGSHSTSQSEHVNRGIKV